MSYRVFARKYRPQRFQEVVGQRSIIQTLQNAISSQKLAQAYLFVGPRGVGKTSIARIFAKALNCHEGVTIDPCGRCASCLEIAEGHSMDVLEIDGASNNSVESIRTLRENAAFAPARGPYKIYLIDEVHMLTTAAFNALLKTLEEPPEHVKFIFATTEAQKLPATITSRCQRFDLSRLTKKEIADHLLYIAQKEEIILSPEAALVIAHGADGALRDAESMLDQLVAFCGMTISEADVQHIFGFTPNDLVHQLGKAILTLDVHAALTLIQEQSSAGKDLSRLLNDLITFFRDLLVETVHPSSEQTRFSLLRNRVTSEKLLRLLEELGKAEERFRWATDKKLQFDVLVIKAIHLLQEVSLSEVLDVLTSIREGAPRPAASQKVSVLPETSAIPVVLTPPPIMPLLEKLPLSQSTLADHEPLSKAADVHKIQASSSAEHHIASVAHEDTSSWTLQDRLATGSSKEATSDSERGNAIIEVMQQHPSSGEGAIDSENSTEHPREQAEAEEVSQPAVEIAFSKPDPWSSIAASLASESPLKFGWLTSGRFVERRNHQMVIEFPSSYEAQTETLFWPQARKKIQECLTKNLGEKMELVAHFTGEEIPEEPLNEEIIEVLPRKEEPKKVSSQAAKKTEPAASAQKSNAVPALTPEELEQFKNDPLIKKALELFQAEIMTG